MRSRRAQSAVGLALYSRAAQKSSARIIRVYSTSFGLATRLLGRNIRPEVESIYGLVRIADEIVDGAAAGAGLAVDAQEALLDALESETEKTLLTGYSTNLIVHSFATTARRVGIGDELIAPFFASMRRDLDPTDFTDDDVRRYIYGSAEVIGLMCLKVFLNGVPCESDRCGRLEDGARHLGSALQKINFLRDLHADWNELQRNYFPHIDPAHLTEAQKLELIADIEFDLDAAAAAIPELPQQCRAAVDTAHGVFTALAARLREVPASQLLETRIHVPTAVKLRIVLQAKTRSMARRTR